MFTIRGKLLIFALEIVAAGIVIGSMPPQENVWIQLGLASVAMDCRIAPPTGGEVAVHCLMSKSLWDKPKTVATR